MTHIIIGLVFQHTRNNRLDSPDASIQCWFSATTPETTKDDVWLLPVSNIYSPTTYAASDIQNVLLL